MEAVEMIIRYTIALSVFALAMLVMFRRSVEVWDSYEADPMPPPQDRPKPSPLPAKERIEAPEPEDITCSEVTASEAGAMEWSVKYNG
jgi:hypothetical protein